jgi:hypothetical protein
MEKQAKNKLFTMTEADVSAFVKRSTRKSIPKM